MKQFKGYNPTPMSRVPKLPAGAYVCKILKVEEKAGNYGNDYLELSFDICEGEYKDLYRKRFESDKNSSYGQRWKGIYRITIPNDSNDEKDEKSKRMFNSNIYAFERSNQGYRWNWDSDSLKGKIIGVIFQNVEAERENGETFWFVKPKSLEIVSKVRDGSYYKYKDQPLVNRKRGSINQSDGFDDLDGL